MTRYWRCKLAAWLIVLCAVGVEVQPAHAQQSGAQQAPAPSTVAAAHLNVTGDVPHPLSLSIDDLRKMPRSTLKVTNPHEQKDQTYEGVALAELLKQAGAPQSSAIRGAALATYVMAEAADGYRVVFSLAELDSDFEDSGVIVADRVDGHDLENKVGPLRLVVPHDKRPARWIRMLQTIKVVAVSQ